MNDNAIIAPLFALAGWTGIVLVLVLVARVRAGRRGELRVEDFRYGESPQVPAAVCLPNRNYMNLLELPVLFYVICLILRISGGVTPLSVSLAWAYVVLRVVHSLIHLSYNRVFHRLGAFFLSNAGLVALWVFAGMRLAAA